MSIMPTEKDKAYSRGMEERYKLGRAEKLRSLTTGIPIEWRIHKAFELIRDACTVSILSLEEMEAVVQRAFNGEFDSDYRG